MNLIRKVDIPETRMKMFDPWELQDQLNRFDDRIVRELQIYWKENRKVEVKEPVVFDRSKSPNPRTVRKALQK